MSIVELRSQPVGIHLIRFFSTSQEIKQFYLTVIIMKNKFEIMTIIYQILTDLLCTHWITFEKARYSQDISVHCISDFFQRPSG